MAKLGVNIDHVATLRQARMGLEPDPVWAAVEAELAGADVITLHLREDRRHVQDHDYHRLKTVSKVKLNLEMAPSEEMMSFALANNPDMVTLVPEGRQELTTEGGLNLSVQKSRIESFIKEAHLQNIEVSAFIEPDPDQIDIAEKLGFDACELHTGAYAEKFSEKKGDAQNHEVLASLENIRRMIRIISEKGMKANAGHALDYKNVSYIASIEHINELHIGFSIISRSIFSGIRQAVSEMQTLIS